MADTLKDKITKEIAETCSCNSFADGKPQNPGWRLEKYGKDCNWSICPKEWSVIEDNFCNIIIKWTCFSTPIEPAVNMLMEVLKSVNPAADTIFIIKLADCDGKESKELSFEW